MIIFKPIQTSFTTTVCTLFQARRPTHTKSPILCLCKSNDYESEASPPQGDTRKQELLARIAMLQTQKVRLTDYLDETADYLTQFAEDANVEFDKIGEDALKRLDEATNRIQENMESQMQAFEESAELNRIEIENNENKLADFESRMAKERNEGMFFKNLGQRSPSDSIDKAQVKEETEKIKELTKAKAGSKTRMKIYLALTGLTVIAIADSFITSPDWKKVAVLGAILVGLITQLSYEQRISSETAGTEREKTDRKKK